ncbi:hypothetical protein GL325_04110 [Aeromicrobium sp. 636]|uniref:Uncharacterized protein n=1 Tax=Aeromicrobium senzhongii TaxID=2663859 RepID=A0A8I0JZP5_9ACTN|nr:MULTISPECIES: hypothetical protein [Aeromicrobium]MBC9225501.1 hypothetical protein [Aeromicrobium senzhongii]MCQ3997611.1 hypothetical protein [Aeromicrobium sp. 636]
MGELIAALVALVVPGTGGCDALTALDTVRTAAWTTADEGLLSGIYGSDAGRADVERLRAWHERGVTVEGARTIRASCRDRGAAGIEVVERLGPTVAVLPDGARRRLPADGWSRRTVDLEREGGRWRIVRVS